MSDATDPRARLEDERGRARDRLADLRAEHARMVDASRDTNADDEHDPEGATIAFERSQLATLIRQGQDHLTELDAALSRLDDGTYGRCESCGRPIAAARLEARPSARTCVHC